MKKIGCVGFFVLVTIFTFQAFANDNETLAQYRERIGTYVKLSDYSGTVENGEYVSFGSFPQTIKSNDVTISNISETYARETYYRGSDGAWYVKVNAKPWDENCLFSNGLMIVEGVDYYFKIEPIIWRKLDSEKGLLLAESALIANIDYYQNRDTRKINEKTIYPNNYKESKIRAYLNGLSYSLGRIGKNAEKINSDFLDKGFLQIAFTEKQRMKIAKTSVDNSKDSGIGNYGHDIQNETENFCENTQDKIFLLSVKEVINSDYGFNAYNVYGKGNSRIRNPSDFALANYACNSQTGYKKYAGTMWWLRSPYHLTQNDVRCVSFEGDADSSVSVFRKYLSIVPALQIIRD